MLAPLRSRVQIQRLRRRGLRIASDARLQGHIVHLRHGAGCLIGSGSLLVMDESGPITLGERVVLGEYSNVRASGSPITIGSDVLFAQFVSVIAENHVLDADGKPDWTVTDRMRSGVTIGAHCWLATHSIVLPGVTLGERCIVGAGAVVTRSFPAGSRLVGAPARAL